MRLLDSLKYLGLLVFAEEELEGQLKGLQQSACYFCAIATLPVVTVAANAVLAPENVLSL